MGTTLPSSARRLMGLSSFGMALWRMDENKYTFAGHDGGVVGVTVHPTGDYAVSASFDGSWSFLDVQQGSELCSIYGTSKNSTKNSEAHDPIYACAFHPDGLLVGTGTGGDSNALRIWDVRGQECVGVLDGHNGAVKSISFSENGYFVATGSEDGCVKIWDMRKLKCTATIESMKDAGPINAVTFDYSGTYLAMGCSNRIEVTVVKDWSNTLTTLTKQTKPIKGLAWGPNASFLASASMDKSVVMYRC